MDDFNVILGNDSAMDDGFDNDGINCSNHLRAHDGRFVLFDYNEDAGVSVYLKNPDSGECRAVKNENIRSELSSVTSSSQLSAYLKDSFVKIVRSHDINDNEESDEESLTIEQKLNGGMKAAQLAWKYGEKIVTFFGLVDLVGKVGSMITSAEDTVLEYRDDCKSHGKGFGDFYNKVAGDLGISVLKYVQSKDSKLITNLQNACKTLFNADYSEVSSPERAAAAAARDAGAVVTAMSKIRGKYEADHQSGYIPEYYGYD